MGTSTVDFQIAEQQRERLDKVADELAPNRDWVINKAITDYLEQYEWERTKIKRGIADFAAGRSFSSEELQAKLEDKMRVATGRRNSQAI